MPALFDGVTEATWRRSSEVDRDMNGEIDFNEFITLIDSLGSHLSILQQAKPGADADGDGGGTLALYRPVSPETWRSWRRGGSRMRRAARRPPGRDARGAHVVEGGRARGEGGRAPDAWARGRRGRPLGGGREEEGGSPGMGAAVVDHDPNGRADEPRGVRMARDSGGVRREGGRRPRAPLLPFDPLRPRRRMRALVPKAHEAKLRDAATALMAKGFMIDEVATLVACVNDAGLAKRARPPDGEAYVTEAWEVLRRRGWDGGDRATDANEAAEEEVRAKRSAARVAHVGGRGGEGEGVAVAGVRCADGGGALFDLTKAAASQGEGDARRARIFVHGEGQHYDEAAAAAAMHAPHHLRELEAALCRRMLTLLARPSSTPASSRRSSSPSTPTATASSRRPSSSRSSSCSTRTAASPSTPPRPPPPRPPPDKMLKVQAAG